MEPENPGNQSGFAVDWLLAKPTQQIAAAITGDRAEMVKASQDLFYSIYGNNFERHRLFAARYQQTDARIKQANKKGLDFETWQRQQILTEMAQAFHTIARKANF